jgi:hypothetical protein
MTTNKKDTNSLPELLDTARMTLNDFAAWAEVSRSAANFWREDKMLPQPVQLRKVLAGVRKRANDMLRLADVVEAEAKKREDEGRKRDKAPRRRRRSA